jgi:quercetin 2,3-dioxygenase
MLIVRKSEDRYFVDRRWLKAFHSLSLINYNDFAATSWGNLLRFNEDRIAPGTGFAPHRHHEMEIINYEISSRLGHKDSIGNVHCIPPRDVQLMSAGIGGQHSEVNHAANQIMLILKICMVPNARDIAANYEQKKVPPAYKRAALCCIAALDGGILKILADAARYVGLFDSLEIANLPLATGRKGYVHLIHGSLQVNGVALSTGNAAILDKKFSIHLSNGEAAEVLVFAWRPNYQTNCYF